MSGSRTILVCGGIALAVFGMLYGLHYAVFIEHQTLDDMGGALAEAFVHSAERRLPEAHAAIETYAETKFNYVRQVDAHSHWIGLAMVMIVLGVVFERLGYSEQTHRWMALAMLAGSVVFPLGVILQTVSRGFLPVALAVAGSALVTIVLAAVAFGFVWQHG